MTYLEHHGILGMHWGIRRYQNPDGTLTPEGKAHYQKQLDKAVRKENDSYKIHSKASDQFNKELKNINAKKYDYYGEKYYTDLDKAWKNIYGTMLKEKYGDIAGKLYKDEKEWLRKFDTYDQFESTIEEYRKLGK